MPRIVPVPRDRRKDGHVDVRGADLVAIATPLLADVAQRVGGAPAIALVQHDQVREVDHVDLLELGRRAVVRRHHVERRVDAIDDLRVALPDAGGLEEDQIEARGAQHGEAVARGLRQRAVRLAGGHGADEDRLAPDRVHADAVAEQRAPGAAPGRIDQQERDAQVRRVAAQAHHELVDDAGLAGPARPREADHRRAGAAVLGELRAETIGVVLVAIRVALEEREAADRPRADSPRRCARRSRPVPRPVPSRARRAPRGIRRRSWRSFPAGRGPGRPRG